VGQTSSDDWYLGLLASLTYVVLGSAVIWLPIKTYGPQAALVSVTGVPFLVFAFLLASGSFRCLRAAEGMSGMIATSGLVLLGYLGLAVTGTLVWGIL
jgi:hypothetical protein